MATGDVTDYLYPLDETGSKPSNLVQNEKHTLNPPQEELEFHFFLPWAGPFYRDTMVLVHTPTGRTLVRGTDWAPGHKFNSASYELQNIKGGIYASVMLYDLTLSGEVVGKYQNLGGQWCLDENKILEIMSNKISDPRFVTWDEVSGKPEVYPPSEHNHPADDLTGMRELVAANMDIAVAIRERTEDWLDNPPILPGDVVDEKIELNNQWINGKFDNSYNQPQIDQIILNLKTTLQDAIAEVAAGGSGALDNYYNKTEGDARYVLKTDADLKYATKEELSAGYYGTDEIDDKFDALNSNLTGVVTDTVNTVVNQYTVDACTTANITLANMQTIDGIALDTGKIVLAAFQTDAKQNGMYRVDTGTWARVSYPITEGLLVKVRNGGTAFGSTQWDCTNKGAIVIGTTNIGFKRIGNMGKRDLFVSTSVPDVNVGVIGDVWFQI